MNRYQSEAEIQNVVRGFESCETGADEWREQRVVDLEEAIGVEAILLAGNGA